MADLTITSKFEPATGKPAPAEDGPAPRTTVTLDMKGKLVIEFPAHAIPADIACEVANQVYHRTHTAVLDSTKS